MSEIAAAKNREKKPENSDFSIRFHKEKKYTKEDEFLAEIKAIDAIMGSGKTSWAIQYMNEHRDKRFIYITPYLDETKRIKQYCKWFVEPEDYPYTKQGHFLKLLNGGKCIVTTHELFKRCQISPKISELISEHNYILILDEMIDVVQKINISAKDFNTLFSEHYVEAVQQDDGTEVVRWIDDEYSGKFDEFKQLIKSKTIIKYRNNMLVWLLPPELLRTFNEIYILTFMFKDSMLEQYLKIHGMGYELCYIQRSAEIQNPQTYELVTGMQDISMQKAHIRELISIYEGDLNKIGDDRKSLNFTFWDGVSPRQRRLIANNALKYFEAKEARPNEIMWTCFKGRSKTAPNLNNQYQKRFLSCNTRATNKWSGCCVLAYLVNVHPDPNIMRWFMEHDVHVDEEQYALSTMIQWVWRSAIRTDKPIAVYVPSKRMRELLKGWLNDYQ